jgi:putative transposase
MILELIVPGRGSLVSSASPSYQGHRYPVEVISHCVWLYFRFPLSFREVEELMLERGVLVSYETIRRWCAKFGQAYADGLRRRRPRPGDKWHLDEVFIKINGDQKYLWRAVDQDGTVLDILVQNRRDTAAARRFFRRLLKTTRTVPRVIITDKLRSYGAAHRQVMPSVEHRSHKGLNNRAENSHQPTRQRERAMKGFRSVGAARPIPPRGSTTGPAARRGPGGGTATATPTRGAMSTTGRRVSGPSTSTRWRSPRRRPRTHTRTTATVWTATAMPSTATANDWSGRRTATPPSSGRCRL